MNIPDASVVGFATGGVSYIAGTVAVVEPRLKLAGLGLLAVGSMFTARPALADQYRMAGDNARVECVASKKDLTRISLVGDQFASLNKVATGVPYNDFSVVNEPVRGDIYLSVPETYAAKTINFFATSKKGYVYKFACTVGPGRSAAGVRHQPRARRSKGAGVGSADAGRGDRGPPDQGDGDLGDGRGL